MTLDRDARLQRVLRYIGRTGMRFETLPSDSNDAWLGDGIVLRICWQGDRARFDREALVLAAMPDDVPVPRLLELGQQGELAWQVSEAIEGLTLGAAWSGLDQAARRAAMVQVGEALAALNNHAFPAEVTKALGALRPSAEGLTGTDLNPLPVPRVRALLSSLSGRYDAGLLAAVGSCLDESLDPFGPAELARAGCVVHGDAHPMNVLWNNGLTALLDFEWARLGTPIAELVPFAHRGYHHPRTVEEVRHDLTCLAIGHPAAFAGPTFPERLWHLDLAFTLRELALLPPDAADSDLHPLRRLHLMTKGPDYLADVLP